MRLTFACPVCGSTVLLEGVEQRSTLPCSRCDAVLPMPQGALTRVRTDGTAAGQGMGRLRLHRCLVCPGTELFTRKDFPQRLGVGIVVAGFAASCVTWAWRLLIPTFAILFATALVDVLLYLLMPECLTCYRCQARYRGDGVADDHGGFDLETHEKHRQGMAREATAKPAGSVTAKPAGSVTAKPAVRPSSTP
jgi:hypothetical protein